MGTRCQTDYIPRAGERDDDAFRKALDNNQFDCAIVAVPDHLHFEVTKYLLEKRIACLVVKPLVATLRELDILVDLQKRSQVFCAVEFHKRYDEANLKMRHLIREGEVGEILYFLVEYSQRKSIPIQHFSGWIDNTNIFQYLGVHYVDLIHFLTDAVPCRVLATGQKKFLRSQGIDNYDSIQALIEWDYSEHHPEHGKRFISSIATNWVDSSQSTAMSDQKIKVIGTRGRIESDQKDRGLSLTSDALGKQDINPYFSDFQPNVNDTKFQFRGYGFRSIYQFLVDTSEIVTQKTHPQNLQGIRATFHNARVSTSVIQAVNQSLASNNEWIVI